LFAACCGILGESRSQARPSGGWLVWRLVSFFPALQHCFLPSILDGRFMLWRFGRYLPFTFFAGLTLLPPLAIANALMDVSPRAVYFMV